MHVGQQFDLYGRPQLVMWTAADPRLLLTPTDHPAYVSLRAALLRG